MTPRTHAKAIWRNCAKTGHRRKAMEYSNDGSEAKATDAQRWFKGINAPLIEYLQEDIQACLKRHGG